MGQRLSLPARLCSSSAMPSGSNTDSDRERESSEGGNTPVRSGLVRAHSSGPANAPQSFFNRSEPRPRAASLVFGRRSRKSGRNKEKVESSSQTHEQSTQLQQQELQEPQPGPSGIQSTSSGKKGKSRGQQNWASKLNCRKMKVGSGKTVTEASDIPQPSVTCEACVCTGYRRTAEHHLGAGVVFQAAPYRQELPEVDSLPPRDPDDIAAEEAARAARQARRSSCPSSLGSQVSLAMGEAESVGSLEQEEGEVVRDPVIDLSRFRPEDFPTEDCDELARLERAREMREGVEPPPGFSHLSSLRRQLNQLGPDLLALDGLAAALFHSHVGTPPSGEGPLHMPSLPAILHHALPELMPPERVWTGTSMCFTAHRDVPYTKVHTQVDYIHCLVPDLHRITACSFYWGKMDRYEAERLLEGRPEGSFLLRDSAQDEYLFSVSFRKYGRSLHARIEQWNHRFSFDSHDPGVFASGTVCGLIEHYKDPACCMFFEPMLTLPLPRTNPFSLQHLSRAVVCSRITYDGVTQLHIPKPLKAYLKEYHYKQRVRVRRYDNEN